MSYGGGYDESYYPSPEGPEGSYATPDSTRCCEDRVCNCLSGSLAAIASATAGIYRVLDERKKKPCEDIDECIDYIIEKVKERFEGPIRSCEECKQMLAAGMGGKIEFAVQCAGACIEETEKCVESCSITNEGECCTTCGQSPCCCKGGECVPCGEESEPQQKWIAWCNPATGSIAVTKQGASPPGPGFYQVGITESEQAAVQVAIANCQQQTVTPSPEPPPTASLLQNATNACNLDLYSTPSGIASFAGGLDSALQVGGWAQIADNLGDIGVGGLTLENFGQIATGVVKAVFGIPMKFSNQIVDSLSSTLNCTNAQFSPIVQVLMNLGLAQKFVGVDLSEFTTQYRYALNALCRQRFLNADQAMVAYLGNSINDTQLDTQWAINGYCPEPVQWYKHAIRSKPTPLQLAIMRHREVISSSEYQIAMRENGYLEPQVAENLYKITEQVPTLVDITRMMVRDVDDADLVNKFGLDTAFDLKYGKQLKQWAKDQGIPDIIAKYNWRAHWSIPSPGQLFEFWHRLRHNDKFGGQEKLLDDIKAALIQQDILPYWHDAYLAVSYRPMFRRDIRRAFEIGAIDEKQVKDAYIQLGHSDEVADTLTDYVKRLRDRAVRGNFAIRLWRKFAIDRAEVKSRLSKDGVPDDVIEQALNDTEQDFDKSVYATSFAKGDLTRQEFVNYLTAIGVTDAGASKIADRVSLRITSHTSLDGYAAGVLTRNDAMAKATSYGLSASVVGNRLDEIDADLSYSQAKRCQTAVKSRYLHGELTKGEAIKVLTNYGTTAERAATLAGYWDCEKSSIGRHVPVSTMCGWLEQGAITAEEFKQRLINLGYIPENAELMTFDCLRSIDERRAKVEQKRQRDQEREQQQQARALARANAALQRESDKLQRSREKAAATRRNRRKQLIAAAEKVHAKCDCGIFDAIEFVGQERDRIIQQFGLGIDIALAILIKAVDGWDTGIQADYSAEVTALAQAAADMPIYDGTNGVPR